MTFIIPFISERDQKSNLQQYLSDEEDNDSDSGEINIIDTSSTQVELLNDTTNYEKNYSSPSQSILTTKFKKNQQCLPM